MTAGVIAAVVIAGAIGSLARYGVSRAFATRGFPWAVLIVNVVGSAIGGGVLALAEHASMSADLRMILLTGFCGGLTTFSTFAVDSVQLVLDGRTREVVASIAANLVLGVGAAAAAYALVGILTG